MTPDDYELYQKNGSCASKSQMKNFINLYAKIAKNVKNPKSQEFDGVKINIKNSYKQEILFTLVDSGKKPVKFNLKEGVKEYIIPVFTDIEEYNEGSEKIAGLFLEELTLKPLTKKDIDNIAGEDGFFKGIVVNPHSQNFMMNKEGNI